ncbi:MAG: hypothetical protein ACRENS_05345, partial [Candidatus Eiseniibacteriota bacterium]
MPGGPRRRRRRRGGGRPLNNSAPQPYANNHAPGGPAPGYNNQRPQARRGRRGRGGGGEQKRGLEILRDMQQQGVALDPTERLILE